MKVRAATSADASSIAPMLAELGYPASSEAVATRIERLGRSEQTGVLVADEAGAVVALLAFQFIELLERPQPTCRITALVTSSAQRRKGAASLLAFYRAHGFDERPRRLVRYLES